MDFPHAFHPQEPAYENNNAKKPMVTHRLFSLVTVSSDYFTPFLERRVPFVAP